ncbi:MAG: DUF1501 domain-containing protein [Pirellulales bacterium]
MNTRRHFLKRCSLAGLGLAIPLTVERLRGDERQRELPHYEGPYYVVVNASGGWDTTYLMDPKGIGGINRLYEEGEILTEGNHRLAPTAKHIEKGMSNEEFFAKYGSELLTINGLDYSINNHSPCSRYMATGKLDSQAYPTFAALVAACKGPECPLSFLTFGNYSSTGNLVPMSRVPYLASLSGLANADWVHGGVHSPYHDTFVIDRIDEALKSQQDAREKTARLPRRERAQSMLYAAQLNSKALQRVAPYISKEMAEGRFPQQAEIALAAFKAGVCVSANLSIGQFDSHANNDRDQMQLIPELLAGIDELLRRAEDMQIRDKLVVVIQSEMGRRPVYNKGNGKDHWSIGSAMFLGPGIQGNRVIGATDEEQFLVPVDVDTLAENRDAGIRIRPEHIHVALRELAGIDSHAASEQFPLDVSESERLQKIWG